MAKKKRIIYLAVAVAVFFVMLCSAVYVAAEANHDCIGENCPICYYISVCEGILRGLSATVCAAAVTAALTHILRRSVSARAGEARCHTLVSLKVRLTD